jgi:hypothetical protein
MRELMGKLSLNKGGNSGLAAVAAAAAAANKK